MLKRGLEHVEVIVGFALFIIFLVFGLYFFNPLDTTRVLDSTSDYALKEVGDNITSQLETYSITFRNSISGFDVVQFPLTRTAANSGVRIESDDGTNLPRFSYNGLNLAVDRQESDFVLVKFGEFNSNPLDPGVPQLLQASDFEAASSDTREVISEKLFMELSETYTSNYNDLKKQFNLPGRIGFAFFLEFSDSERAGPAFVLPSDTQVFSKTEKREVVRLDGTSELADLTVFTW